ncbi:sulfatase maturase [Pseudalgibacter alginicilyticus]|uniref:Sulfatase maturase n=1 Tax=Pseudalgibacter alginicilyticus TaxID=1736674 RepID=A0A0P0D681_9FLAO|nr:ergothioneine biosynthesis protein EgtB [Pseudalgibacter alginicilyticus]ALJ06433.1 sulfatase maturase [Pseudalgibacter alginicilyticus]
MTILNQYLNTRQDTEQLCENLTLEDYIPQSAEFASPPKWHIAHTTWFFEEMILKKFIADYKVFNNQFSFVFNSYYNSLGERIERQHRGLITRPSVQEIFKYRAYVDGYITNLLKFNNSEELEALVILGINHEQQHQELLITDLKYTFSLNPIYPKFSEHNYINDKNSDSGWVSIDEGIYTIGHQKEGFCFDNELQLHRIFLEPYHISKKLVTYGEFIEFVTDGGYKNPKYWLDAGWSWVQANNITQPLYWKHTQGKWQHYTLSGLESIHTDGILSHISFYEAHAYATWKGCRLPTEFEWEIASTYFNWGQRWEWTYSAYLPYPKFKISEGAVGEYNGKFMMNQMVLRGASKATSKNHSRHTYRNFFPAETQWQFTGIRLTK